MVSLGRNHHLSEYDVLSSIMFLKINAGDDPSSILQDSPRRATPTKYSKHLFRVGHAPQSVARHLIHFAKKLDARNRASLDLGLVYSRRGRCTEDPPPMRMNV